MKLMRIITGIYLIILEPILLSIVEDPEMKGMVIILAMIMVASICVPEQYYQRNN